ncbi:alpha/beta fold hydrolase [Pseudomonas synxantha]|uniref:Alpha/beta hydrolase n=1 Tax=Pseudomonas synxantha TaxID=47883 RepID=A0ABS0UM09_9PSED|nr:alpha/beta hydrolase [Pseudomonas synxantha]MBI6566638.1 alpha/beta hydrolase [Pseudomonas synxantha]MBI6579715.1 alpha/beta hydrolase [Pseudomonas synxantha]MBI6645208.1 alpha/beta hydrolase [Pseudomonas synxantha]
MTTLKTMDITHLGGSQIGYRLSANFDPALPTLVLINSFTTSSELFCAQFSDSSLSGSTNLLAIEPYGHGATRTNSEQFTYWDSAAANLQVLENLEIRSAFALGTSQGGWIAARMALLAPTKINGIVLLGTSMDYESAESREIGCWNADQFCSPWISELAEQVGTDWTLSDKYCNDLIDPAFGATVDAQMRSFWTARLKENYNGDDGRARLRMCTINLRDRDSLRGRLDSITCPVLWLHGTNDVVYSVSHAEKEIKMFSRSRSAELASVEGGHHFLSATNPNEVNKLTLEFINRWQAHLA